MSYTQGTNRQIEAQKHACSQVVRPSRKRRQAAAVRPCGSAPRRDQAASRTAERRSGRLERGATERAESEAPSGRRPGGDAGWRGWPASEPGRTSCTSAPGSRASAVTPTDGERLREDDEQGSAAAGRGPAVEGAADGAGDLAGTARPWRAFSKRRRAAGVLARARSGSSWTQGQARPAERAQGGICSRDGASTGRARAAAKGPGSPERGVTTGGWKGGKRGGGWCGSQPAAWRERGKKSVALIPC
jgi:hypothetical protein